MSNQNKYELSNQTSHNRKRVAKFLAPLIAVGAFAGAAYKAPDSHYDPSKNKPQPSYFKTHDGINPADIKR